MLLIITYVLFSILFSLLNLVVVHDLDGISPIIILLIPFHLESGTIIIGRFVLTMALVVSLITFISKCIDEQFSMFAYVLTRVNVSKHLLKISLYTYKKLAMVLAVKIIIDFLFFIGENPTQLDILLTIITVFTCLIWAELFFLLRLYYVPSKFIYQGLIFLIALGILLGTNSRLVTLFVPATLLILEQTELWLIAKLSLFLVLYGFRYYNFKKFEYLGEADYD